MSISFQFPRVAVRQFIASACLAAAFAAAPAHAELMIITADNDSISGGDGCSLREAIINANTDSKLGSIECPRGAGADIIVLQPMHLGISSSVVEEADPAQGDLDITSDVTIVGSGQQDTTLDANEGGRIFDVHAGGTLTISGFGMENGFDALAGGTIRVAGLGILDATDISIGASAIDPLEPAGMGAGIYLAAGAGATIRRSAFIGSHVSGDGAGIHCDGCDLLVESSTFANNAATASGAGIYIANGSDVVLNYVTFGYNDAPVGAGVHSWGALNLHAALLADNGGGAAGDDLECSGGTFAATSSFVEYPRNCAPLTGVLTRTWLPGNTEASLLQQITHQRFDGQPSAILQWRTILPTVAAVDCVGHLDQHLRSAGVAQPCDIGAFQRPVLSVNPMRYSTETNAPAFAIGFGLHGVFPAVDTWVRVSAIGGIEEDCDLVSADLLFEAGTNQEVLIIDPDTLFLVPALGRAERVCELEGRVLPGGDPALEGMTSGLIRVIFRDTSIESASGVSSPAPGTYLSLGTVPVGAGGTANIYFRPPSSDWSITGVTFSGIDPDKFSTTQTFPLLLSSTGAGHFFPVQCLGGELGDFDALMEVATDNPSFPILIYGLRCRAAHIVSLTVPSNSVVEGQSLTLTVSLDSLSILPAPLTLELVDVLGSAYVFGDARINPGSLILNERQADYEAFAGTITINPGEQSVPVTVATFDDLIFLEGVETFGAELELAFRDDVALSPTSRVSMEILDNDTPETGMSAVISGMPTALSQGSQVDTVEVTVVNTSDVDDVDNLDVSFTVDDPVRILGHVVTRIDIPCDAHRDWLIRTIEDPVAEAAALAAFNPSCPPTDPEDPPIMVSSSDEVNNGAALALLRGTFCSIRDSQQAAVCSMDDPLPNKAVILVKVVLEMAKMVEPPKLDYPGSVRAKAQGRVVGGDDVQGSASAPYVIKGKGASGGSLALPALMVVGLLALRGRRKRSVGREAGGVSVGVASQG